MTGTNRKKIALVSDSVNAPTAYGKVTMALAKGMEKLGWEASNMALQWSGAPAAFDGIAMYPAADPSQMEMSIMHVKPDVVVSVRDAWVHTDRWFAAPGRVPYNIKHWTMRYGGKTIIHSPVQSDPLPQEFVDTAKNACDAFVTMSEYGRNAMIAGGAPADRVYVLYHGVNPDVFKPLDTPKADIREKLDLPTDGTMLMFVGLHLDGRKMQPLLMEAFRRYLETDRDAFLYMHCDPQQFYALDQHAKAMKLAGRNKVILKRQQGVMWGVGDAEMNELMNAADVYVSLTAAEGFNYPAAEASVSGLPLVLTDFPVHREVFGDAPGVGFVPATKTVPTVWSLDWHADVEKAAELIAQAVREGKGQERKQWMPDKFRWEKICGKLDGIIREMK